MAPRASFILESNFDSRLHSSRLSALKERYAYATLQVQCKAAGDVLYRRFRERAEAPARHPGHVDAENLGEITGQLQEGKYEPLDIGGALPWVDTSDFAKVDHKALESAVATFLDGRRRR